VVGLKPAICEYWTAAVTAASMAACMSVACGAGCACWFIRRRVDIGVELMKESERSLRFGKRDLMVEMSVGISWLGGWVCCSWASPGP